jgi:hypothetical protein
MPDQNCEPGVLAQNGHRHCCFLEETKTECPTASSRNLNRQKDEALVGGRQVSSDRSHLSHMAGAKKLPAPLRQVSGNYAKARAERVLRVLAFLFSSMIGKATRMTKSDQFRVPERVTLLLESAEVALC